MHFNHPIRQTPDGVAARRDPRAQSLYLGLCQRVSGLWLAKGCETHAAQLFPRGADPQRGGRHPGSCSSALTSSSILDRDRGQSARRQPPPADQTVARGDRPVHARLIATARILRFTPRKARPDGPVAQRLEPAAHNGLVGGSSPSRPTSKRLILFLFSHR